MIDNSEPLAPQRIFFAALPGWVPPAPRRLPYPDGEWLEVTSFVQGMDPREVWEADRLTLETTKHLRWQMHVELRSAADLILPPPLRVLLTDADARPVQPATVTRWEMRLEHTMPMQGESYAYWYYALEIQNPPPRGTSWADELRRMFGDPTS